MTTEKRMAIERKALKSSLYGVLFFIALALGFAVLTHSDAILFDGVFSLVGFCMTLLTLKVAQLVERPDDDLFHFGYSAMEPTLNLFKSLIIIVICVFAFVGALNRLLDGGTPAQYSWAVIYGFFATLGCFLVSWYMYRSSGETNSDLVLVEAKNWFVDGMLSGSVFLGFISAWTLEQVGLAEYAPLVDPSLLMLLVLLSLPIPARVMYDSLKEVLDMAPADELVSELESRLRALLEDVPTEYLEFRVSKQGRSIYVLVHVVVEEHFSQACISDLDNIRRKTQAELRRWNSGVLLDILFIRDRALAG